MEHRNESLLDRTTEIVSAYASVNHLSEDGLISVMRRVHRELQTLEAGVAPQAEAKATEEAPVAQRPPAVPIEQSVHDDYLICLEDGAKVKVLKRYLNSRFNLTPAQYRAKWGLPADYPMSAPSYSARRSEMARKIGLGRKRVEPAPVESKGKGRRTRAS